MDVKLEWKVSSDVDDLVKIVLKCRQELTNVCFSMNGAAKVLSTDVYAFGKVIELFKLSDMWKDASDAVSDEPDAKGRVHWQSTLLVADFGSFKLHSSEVMGEDKVRIVMVFDVNSGVDLTMYGNVDLV